MLVRLYDGRMTGVRTRSRMQEPAVPALLPQGYKLNRFAGFIEFPLGKLFYTFKLKFSNTG